MPRKARLLVVLGLCIVPGCANVETTSSNPEDGQNVKIGQALDEAGAAGKAGSTGVGGNAGLGGSTGLGGASGLAGTTTVFNNLTGSAPTEESAAQEAQAMAKDACKKKGKNLGESRVTVYKLHDDSWYWTITFSCV